MPLDSCLVVKLGGSVITDRDRPYTLNPDMCLALIKRISKLKRSRPLSPVILVLGGGSYGHSPVREFGLDLPVGREPGAVSRFSRLTIGLYSLVCDFMKIAFDQNLELHSFQSSSLLTCRDGQVDSYFSDGIEHCLRLGGVPLITGGSVFDENLGQIVFGSDRIPELLARMFRVTRCVFVSDVEGVTSHVDGGVYEEINAENCSNVFSSIYISPRMDVTGGMRGKVEAALRLAQVDVESIICSAATFLSTDDQHIASGELRGTKFRPSLCRYSDLEAV